MTKSIKLSKLERKKTRFFNLMATPMAMRAAAVNLNRQYGIPESSVMAVRVIVEEEETAMRNVRPGSPALNWMAKQTLEPMRHKLNSPVSERELLCFFKILRGIIEHRAALVRLCSNKAIEAATTITEPIDIEMSVEEVNELLSGK